MSNHGEHSNGLIAWFSHNSVAANILMLVLLVGGLISISTMRVETFPSIDPKLITVVVPYPGGTPLEIAESITSRVEEGLIGIDGVKRISAVASEGSGVVYVELEDFADGDDVLTEVENTVNSLSDFPPEDAERPVITKIKATPNVLALAVHGKTSEETIKYWTEHIEEELKQLPAVALTSVRGIRDYQISIEVSEHNLRRYNLSLLDVGNTVTNFSIDASAGTIESRQGDVVLRIQDKRYNAEDFRNIVVATLEDGASLRLGDIAQVIDGFEDTNLISKFNGERAAFIDISRNESEDTLEIAQQVKDYLLTTNLPQGINVSVQRDETIALEDRINLMLRNGLIGFVLVFLVLLLFLDLKLAFWTSVAIPVSFLGGIMMINFLGYSINMISLFALIVVLGIVVDDAIVTGESIFDAHERHKDSSNSTMKGTYAVMAPVIIGVSTTMAAFAPLMYSTGILGQIIKAIPVVVISILLISLFEAFFILPSHLSNPKRWSKGIMASIRDKFSNGLFSFVDNILIPFARFTIKWRYATLTAFTCLAIITAGMFSAGIVRFVFFPQVEADEVTINVTMPKGIPFALTQETMLKIEKVAIDLSEELKFNDVAPFKSLSLSIGSISSPSNPAEGSSNSNSPHLGQLRIELVQSQLRSKSSGEIETMMRERIQDFPNIEELELLSSLIGEEADIEVVLSHADEDILTKASQDLKTTLENFNGTKEISDSFELGKAEFVFELSSEGLAAGLSPSDLGRQLRASYFGLEVQRFQRGRSEVIVYVRYPENERDNIASLENTRIRLPDGQEVPLKTVATIKKQLGYSLIETVNGRRTVTVTSDVDYKVTSPASVMAELRNKHLPELKSQFPGLSYSFEGESREQQEDLASLGRNMVIALMIIYVLLGSILRSYIQPIIIMSAIPFGVVGAIWGHFLLGHDVSFISLFGIVALTGVVVNDSVVLMDFYNKQRLAGLDAYDSILAAIKRRFRPILLTTLTTSVGLLPMLLETSLQAQFLIPMVVSLATGIIFATFVILFFIPCLILVLRDIKHLFLKCVPKI